MSLPTGYVIVTGAPQSGKTTFISSIFGTSRPIFARVDWLHVVVDHHYVVDLAGLQLRNLCVDDASYSDLCAVFLMVDSTDARHIYEAQAFLKLIRQCYTAPCLIIANKQDHETALTIGQITRDLQPPHDVGVFACDATDMNAVRALFLRGLRYRWPDVQRVTG